MRAKWCKLCQSVSEKAAFFSIFKTQHSLPHATICVIPCFLSFTVLNSACTLSTLSSNSYSYSSSSFPISLSTLRLIITLLITFIARCLLPPSSIPLSISICNQILFHPEKFLSPVNLPWLSFSLLS